MVCQSEVFIGDNLTFTIVTLDPTTGALSDADALPTYRVYEDETAVAILTGNMTLLDAVNTTGFYSEQIACTAGNGFESDKSYNIYVGATVNSIAGGISCGFRARTEPDYPTAAEIRSEMDSNSMQLATILADTNELQTDDVPGLIAALNDLSLTDIQGITIEGALTLQYVLRILLAFVAGRTVGANTASIQFKSQDGGTNRISMAVDEDGDRSTVTVNGS